VHRIEQDVWSNLLSQEERAKVVRGAIDSNCVVWHYPEMKGPDGYLQLIQMFKAAVPGALLQVRGGVGQRSHDSDRPQIGVTSHSVQLLLGLQLCRSFVMREGPDVGLHTTRRDVFVRACGGHWCTGAEDAGMLAYRPAHLRSPTGSIDAVTPPSEGRTDAWGSEQQRCCLVRVHCGS